LNREEAKYAKASTPHGVETADGGWTPPQLARRNLSYMRHYGGYRGERGTGRMSARMAGKFSIQYSVNSVQGSLHEWPRIGVRLLRGGNQGTLLGKHGGKNQAWSSSLCLRVSLAVDCLWRRPAPPMPLNHWGRSSGHLHLTQVQVCGNCCRTWFTDVDDLAWHGFSL
jgi:hypothetical protein